MKSSVLWLLFAGLAVLLSTLLLRADEISDLDSPKYAIRVKAQKELESKMTFELYVKIRDSKKLSLSPEASRRLAAAMNKFLDKMKDEYHPDLKGYPDYPWICWEFEPDYKWNGVPKSDLINYYTGQAQELGIPNDSHPNWSDWRKATYLWLYARIYQRVDNLLVNVKSEKEFRQNMTEEMKTIDQDIQKMIKGDDDWWRARGVSNPLREAKKPDF